MVISLVWRSPFVFRVRVSKKAFTFSARASSASKQVPHLPAHLQRDIGLRDGVVARRRQLND